MSRSLNKVMLIGNVGSEPEVKVTGSGSKVAKLSIATNRSFQDRSGQQQERTDWHRLTIFGRLVDVVEQWVHKGDRLYVEGRIEYSQTDDPQSGTTRYWTDIIVQDLVMLGSGGAGGSGGFGGQGSGGGFSGSAPSGPPISEPDDDLPF